MPSVGVKWLVRLAVAALAVSLVAACGSAAPKQSARTTTSATTTAATTAPSSRPSATGTSPLTTSSTGPTTTVSVPPAEAYSWQRDTGLALDLGGGSSSTLSAVVAPGPGQGWLIAGTQFSSAGSTVATVWTSTNATTWDETALPTPAGGTDSQALAAVNWGARRLVVGSIGTGASMTAAVWVSPGPASAFSLATSVANSTSPTTTTTATTATTTTATTTPATSTPATSTSATSTSATSTSSTSTSTTVPGNPVPESVMDQVTAGTLGLFASGTLNGKAAMWYSSDGQDWSLLAGADQALDHDPGAVVNSLLSTSHGVFAAGSWANGDRTSAALWYSGNGIHWGPVNAAAGSFTGPGDHVITALVNISETGSSGGSGPSGLLAVGGTRVGPTWQPASWISPDGFSWSETSESFTLNNEPPGSAGALVYAATAANDLLYAVGGSPERQRFWTSQQGLAWSASPLPAGAVADTHWHLGLVAVNGGTMVLADNLPGQPFVLVRQGTQWSQPSATGAFGNPLPTATPTSLIDDTGTSTLVMSVDLSAPGARLGRGRTSVAILTSTNGQAWRTADADAFPGAEVSQLLPVPGGVMAVGQAGLSGPVTGSGGWTGAFASLSADMGATWPNELISPAGLGSPVSSLPASSAGGTSTPAGAVALSGPFSAKAAGRVGTSQYVVGEAGPVAVAWSSPAGLIWQGAQALDSTPPVNTEQVLYTCSSGSRAVVVGSTTTTGYGSLPAAWTSTDGSTWVASSFLPTPAAGSFSSVEGCFYTGNGFIAYGETASADHAARPVLWSSSDGTAWQELSTTFNGVAGGQPTGPQTAPLDGVATGTTTWLGISGDEDLPTQAWPAPVGGASGLAVSPPGLWDSTDAGNTWQELDTSSPVFDAASSSQADQAVYVGHEPVVAGTVDGRLAVWVGQPSA